MIMDLQFSSTKNNMTKNDDTHPIDITNQYSNLVNYYIDCVEEENLQSLTFRRSQKGKQFLKLNLSNENFFTNDDDIFSYTHDKVFEKYLQKDNLQQKKTLGNKLFYGYPLVMCNDGTISPLFYVEIESIQEINDEPVSKDNFVFRKGRDYNFNEHIFRLLCDLENIDLPESIENIRNKLEDFNKTPHDSSEFTWLDEHEYQRPSDFVIRILKALKYLEYEDFNPNNSKIEPISLEKGENFSIIKCPIIFFNPKASFTNGLLKELRALINPSYSNLNQISENSTLHFIQPDSLNCECVPLDANLKEVFIMDHSQKAALEESLTKKITVITGPPGTGKSQVVCNILVNAMEQGETVLFASKNNKAVDVVKEKLDDIFNDKIIRYGNRQAVNDSNLVLQKISTQSYLDTLPVVSAYEYSEIESSCKSLISEINFQNDRLNEIKSVQEKIDDIRNEVNKIFRQLPHELQKAVECQSNDALMPEFFELHESESPLHEMHNQIEILNSELKSLHQQLHPKFKTIINETDNSSNFNYSKEQIEHLNSLKVELEDFHHKIEDKNSSIQKISDELPESLLLNTSFKNLNALNSLEISEIIGDLNNLVKNSNTKLIQKFVHTISSWFTVRKYKKHLVRKYYQNLTPPLKMHLEEVFRSGLDATKLLECYNKITTVRNLNILLEERYDLTESFDHGFMNMLEQFPPIVSNHICQNYSKNKTNRMCFVESVVLIVMIRNTGFKLKNAKNEFLNIMQDVMQCCPKYLQEYIENNFLIDHSDRMIIASKIFTVVLIENYFRTLNTLQIGLKNKYPSTENIYDNIIEIELRKQKLDQILIESNWNKRLKKDSIKFERLVEQFIDTMDSRQNTRGRDWWQLTMKWGEYFEQLIKEYLPIWITVNLSAQNIPLKSGLFDLLVIDEASQCDIASAIPLIFRAKRVVIIGDKHQLKHISTIRKEKEKKIASENEVLKLHPNYSYREKSLFDMSERIISYINQKPTKLQTHYRSHHKIISFSDEHVYGSLNYATNESKLAQINEYGIKWIDVKGEASRSNTGTSWINQIEAKAVYRILRNIISQNDDEMSYGIVTPFIEQQKLLEKYVRDLDADILVGTVDKFQGDEKDVMIFSPVVSKGIGNYAKNTFAQDKNRINVAVTRAKSLLLIVGDKHHCRTLKQDGLLYQLLEYTEHIESEDEQSFKLSVPEQELWNALKNRDIKFYPQYPVKGYSLDFAYFTKTGKKWDIEIDGVHHLESEKLRKDAMRQQDLKSLGWHTKRFTAREVLNNTEQVICEIERLEVA